jgi:hypothetical protein
MMRLLGVVLLALCLALPARAQDAGSPEAMAAAHELSVIMSSDTMGQVTSAMTAQIWPSIERSIVAKVDATTLSELRGEFEKTLNAFSAEVMKNAPTAYARHFSAQELKDMVAFYKTPTGMKALHEMPKVMADVGAQMAPRVVAFQSDLNARMRAILQNHGYKD